MKKVKLVEFLDHENGLFKLANVINWHFLETAVGKFYEEKPGRPPVKVRLIVGLHYLKYLENKSDEEAVKCFVQNPYWQYFCGQEYFVHEVPLNPSTLSRWRNKLGIDKVEKLLEETINVAKRELLLEEKDLKKLNVDTTVQEKSVTFPTDAKLLHKMRRKLVKACKARGIDLRQSYERVGQRAFIKQGKYCHARQMRRARKEQKKLRSYLGRVLRDIARKVTLPDEKLQFLLNLGLKVLAQKKDDKNKIYSLHAPEVECIAKGKAHKKYEFGCKVSIVTTANSNWIVGTDAIHGNPYDGHTLKSSIGQVERLVGRRPEDVNVDRGYKGKENHPEDVNVFIAGSNKKSRTIKKFLKRRSAIEPVIGHLKSDHRLGRNFLMGQMGDRINAILSASAFNLKKILNCLELEYAS